MERLTDRGYKGRAFMKEPVENEEERTVEIIDRLAAYEDTGLSPADIAGLRNELCLKCGKYKTAHEGSCDGCRWKPSVIHGAETCNRFFVDEAGQGFTVPCCKDKDGRDYETFVTCKGDKNKCCK